MTRPALDLAQEFLAFMGSRAEPAGIAKLLSEDVDWEIVGDIDALPWNREIIRGDRRHCFPAYHRAVFISVGRGGPTAGG